jgi:hypothetical protein
MKLVRARLYRPAMIEYLPPLITASAVVAGAFVARHATRFSARLQGRQRARDAEITFLREFGHAVMDATMAVQAYTFNVDTMTRTHHNQAVWNERWVYAKPALEAHGRALWLVGTLPTEKLRELGQETMDFLALSMQPDVDEGNRVWNEGMTAEDLDPVSRLIAAVTAEQRRLLESYPDDVPRPARRIVRRRSPMQADELLGA